MVEDSQLNIEVPLPPRKTDILFGSGPDWQADACINSVFDDITYPEGYRRAALHLATHVCKTGGSQDFLVYPIVYLYRHHIELTLKAIIHRACGLLDRSITGKDLEATSRHDLAKLWDSALLLLGLVDGLIGEAGLPLEDAEGISSYIKQLHAYDPDGQRFRYATIKPRGESKIWKPSLPPELTYINIRQFSDAMERLGDYLDGLEAWLDDLADAKIEMLHQLAKNN